MNKIIRALLVIAIFAMCASLSKTYRYENYKPILCPNLDDPRNGDLKVTGNRPGDEASYKCDKGFQLVGSSLRKCQSIGDWTTSDPICKRIRQKCPKLNYPRRGDVKVTGYQPGDKARYTCDKGFKLFGNRIRKCQSNGYWTESDPVCKRASRACPIPKRPKNGYVRYSGTSHGSAAYYLCNRGYTLHGSSSSNCNHGDWSDAMPRCI